MEVVDAPFYSHIDKIRSILPEESKDIDPDLLFLVFVADRKLLHPNYAKRLEGRYGKSDYQSLEFLGDGVLEVILKFIIYQTLSDYGPGVMSKVISRLRSNKYLACLANRTDLCKYIITGKQNLTGKICADIFEALIGAIFFHLISEGRNAFKILYEWLIFKWNIVGDLYELLAKEDNPCTGDPLDLPSIDIDKLVVAPRLPVNAQSIIPILYTLNRADLELVQVEINKIQNSRLLDTAQKNLSDFYLQYGLGRPYYNLKIGEPGINIPCPRKICPNGGIIGTSNNPIIMEARKEAAVDAILNLHKMGYQYI